MRAWIYLTCAIVSEVIGTTFLKISDGFSEPAPSVVTICAYAIAFVLLAAVLETIDIGVAYAIWAGSGTALVAVVSFIFLDETIEWPAWIGIAIIIVGVILVEMFSRSDDTEPSTASTAVVSEEV